MSELAQLPKLRMLKRLLETIFRDMKKKTGVQEYYTFSNGKIKSIEFFFGGSGAVYPSNAK
jgi:hypothetical protein